MQAIIKFNLPKEKFDFHQSINGWRYAQCLNEILDYFDMIVETSGKDRLLTAGHVQEMITSIMENEHVSADEL